MVNGTEYKRGYDTRRLEDLEGLETRHTDELRAIHLRLDKLELILMGFAIIVLVTNPNVVTFIAATIKALL